MCLAVPGRILNIHEKRAQVDFGGVNREVCLDLLPDSRVGEYVLVHAGFAIQRLDAEEARAVYSLLRAVPPALGLTKSLSQNPSHRPSRHLGPSSVGPPSRVLDVATDYACGSLRPVHPNLTPPAANPSVRGSGIDSKP